MGKLLVRWFIKNPDDVDNKDVRYAYGRLSSFTGIVCNLLLFALKLILGIVSGAISIISDAFNNLSDCLSCLITLFGYKLAAKPADREHPFGHGRMEYIVSFIVAVIIFVVGFELLRSSIESLLHPEAVLFSVYTVVILVVSILVKLWMAGFNRMLGRKLNNIAMIAAAEDSRNDVVTTAAVLAGMILSQFSSFPFDGAAGVLVSLFILWSGVEISREIISRLLGQPASYELTQKIREIILAHPEVIGVHDMIIHDYGPGKQFGSAHAEVDANMNFLNAHEIIDNAEREIYEKTHVSMTLHLDPVVLDDPRINRYRTEVERVLESLSPSLSMHDFRVVFGEHHNNLVFDVLIPYGCSASQEDIRKAIDAHFANRDPKIYTVITFDRAYTGMKEEGDEDKAEK